MRTIRLGNRGEDVRAWQTFLRGGQIADDGSCAAKAGDAIISDGIFGPATDKETRLWQSRSGLAVDGIVGPNTWRLAVGDRFPESGVPSGDHTDRDVDPDPTDIDDGDVVSEKAGPSWPPRPSGAKPLTKSGRDSVLGKIEFISAPTRSNPEAIRITNDWAKTRVAKFTIPQLSSKPITMHKLAGPQFQAWLAACDRAGVLNIISYAGCWVPRFVRGSRTSLSNHSYASAIDINVPYNRRGRQSALVGEKGCVREMAEIGYDFGIFWGGHYRGAPEDGMHFELFRVLSSEELLAARAKYGV